MTEPLLTIGAFARAVGLSPSALRHYDECGLLRPADVDEVTGYRYYTPDLVDRAEMVAAMREAGLSIEQMRLVLDGGREEAEHMLQEFAVESVRRSESIARLVDVLRARHSREGELERCRVTVRGPELAAALRQVRPAADQDASSALSAVVIDVVDGSMDVAATNRYWMAVRTLPSPNASDPGRVVLGLDAAARLAELLDGCDEVSLALSEEQLTVADEVIKGRRVAFPAHRMVVESLEPSSTRVVVPRDDLVEGVRATGRSEVDLRLSPSGSVLVGGNASSALQELSATVRGESLSLRLGSALLLRALDSVVGPDTELCASGPDRPVRISSPYQPGYLALVMPIAGRP